MSRLILKIKSLVPKLGGVNFSYEKVAIKPEKDWKIILFIVQLLVVAGAVLAIYLYIQINAGNIFRGGVDMADEGITIKRSLFDKIVNDAKNRAENYEKIKTAKTPGDPAL